MVVPSYENEHGFTIVNILELRAWLALVNKEDYKTFYRAYRSPEYNGDRIERVVTIAIPVSEKCKDFPVIAFKFELNYETVPRSIGDSKDLHNYCKQYIQFLEKKYLALPGELSNPSKNQDLSLKRSKNVWQTQ
ncbi:MAG: hypothetical protein ACFFCZ_06805 [Promethearchaeota archaeon]